MGDPTQRYTSFECCCSAAAAVRSPAEAISTYDGRSPPLRWRFLQTFDGHEPEVGVLAAGWSPAGGIPVNVGLGWSRQL